MPYKGEFANKVSHSDIVRNPDIQKFLEDCSYLTMPSDQEGRELAAVFQCAPEIQSAQLPVFVIAFDGSRHETSISDQLPSTKVGYIKIGSMLVDMSQFQSLRVNQNRMVDPFRVAALQNNNSPLTFSLPSANVRWKGKASVRDSFRAVLDQQLYSERTRFIATDPSTSLRTTLFHLASRRPLDDMGTGDANSLKVAKCPSCQEGPITLIDTPSQQYCPFCNNEVYPSDVLRIWEEITDYQSNIEALTRVMSVLEHLLPIHYIRYLLENSITALGSTAFFIDGPLAVFGNSAWIHKSIQKSLYEVNNRLAQAGLPKLVVIGLQKTGQIVDYVDMIKKYIPKNSLFPVSDEYRYQYILGGQPPSKNGFGDETYYGQDVIYKTSSGRVFVFALPYPFETKHPRDQFVIQKTVLANYEELPRALRLINNFESDLYENAVIPIALAHRYTAISLEPGGKVLDLLTRKALSLRRR